MLISVNIRYAAIRANGVAIPSLQVKLSEVSIVDIFVSAPLKLCDLAAMGRSVYAGRSVGVSQTQDEDKEEESQTDEVRSMHV